MSDDTPEVSATDLVELFATTPPPAVQNVRASQPERRLYQTTGFESVIRDDEFEGSDMPAQARAAAVKELRNVLYDVGLSPAEAQQMLNRAAQVRAEGMTAEQARKEARTELARQFGKDGADAALRDAQKLVMRDPRFGKFIHMKGLGNDPQTLIQMARLATSQRTKGLLR